MPLQVQVLIDSRRAQKEINRLIGVWEEEYESVADEISPDDFVKQKIQENFYYIVELFDFKINYGFI